jgi:hypothetical protein
MSTMEFMVRSCKGRPFKLPLFNEEKGLISRLMSRVELFVVIRFVNVELVGANSNNWALKKSICPFISSVRERNVSFPAYHTADEAL